MAPTARSGSTVTSPCNSDWDAASSILLRFHYTNPLLISTSTAVLLLAGYRVWSLYLRRIPNVEALTAERLGGKSLRGVVTSVGDADNFRMYHTPWIARLRRVPSTKQALKDNTIHVRLAGVDAPELAHFGNPAQPYSTEAIDWLTKYVLGKRLRVQLYRKDQYGRVVGMAYVRKFPHLFRRNVSEEMLKAGFATVYTSGGAVHAGLLPRFQALEATARRQGKGMWAQSKGEYESPAAYKKRVAALPSGKVVP